MGPFISGGLVYMEKNLPWTLKIAPMPSINGKRYSVLTGSALLNFCRNKTERDAANQFIFWLVNKKNTIKIFKDVGYIPVRKSAVDSLEIQSFVKQYPNFKVPLDALKYSKPLPQHREYFKVNRMFNEMLKRILREESNPALELARTEEEINAMLAR